MLKKITKRVSFDNDEAFRWFGDNLFCWWCGKNQWSDKHHITGGEFNNSLLNLAPLHHDECHLKIHSILKRKENKKMLLQKTMTYLLDVGYKFNDLDRQFLFKNSEFYQK